LIFIDWTNCQALLKIRLGFHSGLLVIFGAGPLTMLATVIAGNL